MKKRLALTILATLTACASQQQPAPAPTSNYACTGGAIPSIGASYEGNTAILTVQSEDSRTIHTLHQTKSANGQRYTDARTSPAAIGRLVWYTNANKAILYIVTPSPEHPYSYEKQIADCTLQK